MTNKNVAAVRLVERDEAAEVVELPEELRVSLASVAGVAREGLLAMSASVGLVVMHEMMNAEMTAKVGAPKHAKLAGRQANWHGDAPGSVVLGGRRVPVERPRGRTTDKTELELDTYAQFTNDDLLSELVMERMLAGVATRRHAALMLDGVHFAEACCVVALAICVDGTKVPVGLWLGDTENKTIVTNLLADLVDRGLSADGGLLVVIDGAKALAAAVRKVFGSAALIQRCTIH